MRHFRSALNRIKRFFGIAPDNPEDPHAYITARTKPRPPYLRASAIAELPERD